MQKLTYHIPRQTNELTELENWLNETFLAPLEKLGFKMEKYGHVMDEEDEQGVHVLKLVEQDGKNIMDDGREKDYEAMVQICTQDDDGQPHATHRLYNGTLWIFIPYTA